MAYATALMTLSLLLAVAHGSQESPTDGLLRHGNASAEIPNEYFDGLDDEDTPEEEMDDLIGRLGAFRERAEKAQTSKSKEAIEARFFAGLDDDEDDESSSRTISMEDVGSALMELLETGKMPASLTKLLAAKEPATEVEPIDAIGGEAGPGSAASLKEAKVEVDPPAVITTYQDLVRSVDETNTSKVDQPIVLLSRFNFHNNVMSNRSDEVQHWVIRFCHDWYAPCNRISAAYKELAQKSELELNQESLKTTVRFADIDCSTDKPLCNEQGVEYFPKILHYHRGKKVGLWEAESSGDKDDIKAMNIWMRSESAKILKSKSAEYQSSTKNAIKSEGGLLRLDSSWVCSCASMIVTLLAHVWLIRARSQGATENKAEESVKDTEQVATVSGPSGLASMLPEEWVSTATGSQLLEL